MVEKDSENKILSCSVTRKLGRIGTATSQNVHVLLFINFLKKLFYAEGYPWK